MVDSFEEVEHEGFGSRIMESIKGVLVGIALFFICIIVLFWNEGRYIKLKQDLEEGLGKAVTVKSESVEAANEGKLVHTNGAAKTDEVLNDGEFGVSANAVQLKRKAELYQWVEIKKTKKKKKKKKVTTWEYKQQWAEGAPEPFKGPGKSDPKYKNPVTSMPYNSQKWMAENVELGAFKLPPRFIDNFSNFSPYDPSKAATPAADGAAKKFDVMLEDKGSASTVKVFQAIGQATGQKALAVKKSLGPEGKGVVLSAADEAKANELKKTLEGLGAKVKLAEAKGGVAAPAGFKTIPGGKLYKGTDPNAPTVGDMRIAWEIAPAGDCTVVGVQKGDTFDEYVSGNGNEISGIHMGIETKQEFFAKEQAANAMMLWILRIGGFIFMGIGLSMVFRPIVVVADVIPILGDIVGLGFALAAFGIAAVVSLMTIAVGWLFYRPLIGIPLVLLAVGGLVGLIMMAKGRKGGGAAPAAPAGGPVADPTA